MRTRYFLKSKQILTVLFAGILGFSSCSKFLDINQNPNNPDTAEPRLLLPTVEAAISQVVGNQFQVYGGIWSQYWAQNASASQYKTIEDYNVIGTDMDRAWSIIYRSALNNAQIIINEQETPSSEHFKAIAYILKAYTVQLATDAFGDIPLSEAVKSAEFANPKYDSQESVYDSIFNYIDQGISLAQQDATDVGSQDMIFGGDMSKWIAFANTLKLRAYLRLSEIKPDVASAGIKALYDSKAVFLNEDATITYTTVGGNENPLYSEIVGLGYTQNLAASKTAVENFVKNEDPRRFKFYQVLTVTEGDHEVILDTITYLPQGAYNNSKYEGKLYSNPSILVGADQEDQNSATAPVKLISASESYFLQAEAVARGWASGNAEELFNTGITESFSAVGLTNDDAIAYIGEAPDAKALFDNNQIKAIITQKYYAMDGFQGFEAWTEWRRTGYPDFFEISEEAVKLGNDEMPVRLPYPNSEVTSNTNFPGAKTIVTPVWWDK